MGSFTSRQSSRENELDNALNRIYKYPPQSGNYFGNYFIMGGERFEAPYPEAYLFGENMDLNFLGNHPLPFPYPPPEVNDPTRPLRCIVNIRRESVKLVRTTNEGKPSFNIEFIFDTDARCSITIYYFCTEELTSSNVSYICREPALTSDIYYYKRGASQHFIQPGHFFDPTVHSDDDLSYNPEKDVFPIAIHCVALESIDETQQSHTTIAVVDHHADGSYTLKTLKQKLFVDGLCYLLQEVYGIENKINEIRKIADDDSEDGGLECVICISEVRDTLILPCRHLCLCRPCADSLRYQASNCPICRSPFRALLHIKVVHRSTGVPFSIPLSEPGSDVIPAGFEHITLIEALNGPVFKRRFSILEPLSESPDAHFQRRHGLNKDRTRRSGERHSRSSKHKSSSCSCNKDGREVPTRRSEHGIHTAKRFNENKEEEKKIAAINTKLHRPIVHLKDQVHIGKQVSSIEDEIQDEDSEAEKCSPLLEAVTIVNIDAPQGNNRVNDDQLVAVDVDQDSEDENIIVDGDRVILSKTSQKKRVQHKPSITDRANVPYCKESTLTRTTDDSDYYTPEELSTSILNTIHPEKERGSLPGTPASLASLRSSADSYTSTGSSRHLLATHEKPSAI